MMAHYLDDTKLIGVVDTAEGRNAFQRDLDKLERWALVNLMTNKATCKVLHLDQGNPRYVFRLGEERLDGNPAEKDLGVLVDENLNISQKCVLAA